VDGRVPSPPPPAPPSPSPRPHRQKALLLSSTRTSKGLSWDCLPKKGGYNLNGPQYHLVPLTFLVHKKFGPREIWDPRSLVHEKYGTQEIWSPHENQHMAFSFGAQTSRGPNFSGPKFLGVQISWEPKKPGAKIRLGTISVTAKKDACLCSSSSITY
jgi:hypothetical protein